MSFAEPADQKSVGFLFEINFGFSYNKLEVIYEYRKRRYYCINGVGI